jgi:hypothetical protein
MPGCTCRTPCSFGHHPRRPPYRSPCAKRCPAQILPKHARTPTYVNMPAVRWMVQVRAWLTLLSSRRPSIPVTPARTGEGEALRTSAALGPVETETLPDGRQSHALSKERNRLFGAGAPVSCAKHYFWRRYAQARGQNLNQTVCSIKALLSPTVPQNCCLCARATIFCRTWVTNITSN